MKIRTDFYVIDGNGRAARLFDELIDDHYKVIGRMRKLAEELGGARSASLAHPFSIARHGLAAVVFEGKRAPRGWRRHKYVDTLEGYVACVPKSKMLLHRMEHTKSDKSPLPLYRLFGYKGDVMIDDDCVWHRPGGGKLGGCRVVFIPSDASKPPRKAPAGCVRIEEWEYLKLKADAVAAKEAACKEAKRNLIRKARGKKA